MQMRGPGSSGIIFKFLRCCRHPPSSTPTNSIIIMHLHSKLQNKLIFGLLLYLPIYSFRKIASIVNSFLLEVPIVFSTN